MALSHLPDGVRRFCFPTSPQRHKIRVLASKTHEGGGRVVLDNLSGQIRDCLLHAEDCARKAAAQTDPALRDDFLRLEKRWLELARSLGFVERLDSFTKNGPKPNINLN